MWSGSVELCKVKRLERAIVEFTLVGRAEECSAFASLTSKGDRVTCKISGAEQTMMVVGDYLNGQPVVVQRKSWQLDGKLPDGTKVVTASCSMWIALDSNEPEDRILMVDLLCKHLEGEIRLVGRD